MEIIDCHCHAGKADGFKGPWDTEADISQFVAWSKAAGVSRINLFAALQSNYEQGNRQVFDIVKTNAMFSGFAFVHSVHDAGRVYKMVRKCVEEYGFIGIKVHRADAHISREICDTAKTFNLPVLYDVFSDPAHIELFATQYPEVNFIIPHLSSFADDWKSQLTFIDHLVRHPNIYTDTSGVRRFDLLQMALDRAGADKILFGTDGPWLHPAVELEKIYALKLNATEEAKILSGNFLRLTRQT